MDAKHRERLEENLLTQFDRRVEAPAPRRIRWPRYAAIALTVTLLTASQAPAEILLDVGKRITVETDAELPMGEPFRTALEAALGPAAPGKRLALNLRQQADGSTRLTIDAWGDVLAADDVLRSRVHALPGMSAARIEVSRLQGRVQDTLLGKVRHLIKPDASPAQLERARQQVIDELRHQEGPDAQIDVDLIGPSGGPGLRVRVKRPGGAP